MMEEMDISPARVLAVRDLTPSPESNQTELIKIKPGPPTVSPPTFGPSHVTDRTAARMERIQTTSASRGQKRNMSLSSSRSGAALARNLEIIKPSDRNEFHPSRPRIRKKRREAMRSPST